MRHASGAPRAVADIAASDDTVAGSRLSGGVLKLALVARRGMWYPDGPGTRGLPIEAFGEAGKSLQIPGPIARSARPARRCDVRNELGHPLNVRGFAAPSDAATTVLRVANGATRRVSFVLDRAAAFGYYGSDDRGFSNNDPSETIDTRAGRPRASRDR